MCDLAGCDPRERTNVLCEKSLCLDPKLHCGAIHIVWVKVVLETDVKLGEKIVRSAVMHTRCASKRKVRSQRVIVLSEHVRFLIAANTQEAIVQRKAQSSMVMDTG